MLTVEVVALTIILVLLLLLLGKEEFLLEIKCLLLEEKVLLLYAHIKVHLIGDIPAFLRLEPLTRASTTSTAPTTLQLYLLKLLLELEAHDLLVLDMHDRVNLCWWLRLQVFLHTVYRTLDFL